MKSKKMWIAFVVIFLSGIAVGTVGGIYYANTSRKQPDKQEEQQHQDRIKMHMLRRMSAELELTDDQKTKVGNILGDMSKKINDIHVAQRPQIKSIIDNSFAEIDKLLTEDQKVKMTKMQEKIAKFRKKHRQDWDRRRREGRGDGPPPPQWQGEGDKKRFHPDGNRRKHGDPNKRREESEKRQTEEKQKLPPPPTEPAPAGEGALPKEPPALEL